jgi:hypothetical protein
MYMQTSDLITIIIGGCISLATIITLGVANAQLVKQNRFLRSRLRAWRKSCWSTHTQRPF